MRFPGIVPDGNVGIFPDKRITRLEAPAMGASERRVKFRSRMVMIPVEKMGRDDEQAQVKIHRFKGAAFTDDGGKGVIVGEAGANVFAGIGIIGNPMEKWTRIRNGFRQ